jgi:hypothetical protein
MSFNYLMVLKIKVVNIALFQNSIISNILSFMKDFNNIQY